MTQKETPRIPNEATEHFCGEKTVQSIFTRLKTRLEEIFKMIKVKYKGRDVIKSGFDVLITTVGSIRTIMEVAVFNK